MLKLQTYFVLTFIITERTLFTMRISICPLPSVGGVGNGFGHDPAGTHIQYEAVVTMFGVITPVIS